MGITYQLKRILVKCKWRKMNPHNQTSIENITNLNAIRVGNYTYGVLKVLNEGNAYNLSIGNFCSIAPDVCFIVHSDHNLYNISTFPFDVMCLNNGKCEAVSNGNIIVEDDVWIGQGAVILSGVTIHQGAVVAAGAVVTKNVPAYAIVGGVPAQVLKYRFDEKMVEALLEIDYSKLTKEMVSAHVNELSQELKNEEQLEWLPKKYISM